MKKIIFILMSLSVFVVINAQEPIFYDDFSSNVNEWITGENEYRIATIANGEYTLTSKTDDNYRMVWQFIDLSNYKNYTIEVKIKLSQGDVQSFCGIFWGTNNSLSDDLGYINLFMISGDGFARVYSISTKADFDSDWKKFSAVKNIGDYNILKIVKKKNKMSFYVNGKKFVSAPAFINFGDNLGFIIDTKTTAVIDYIKITGKK